MDTKNIHWYGHAAFRIDDDSIHIYVDPFELPSSAPKADIILITHSHFDHFSEKDIKKIRKESTKILAPEDVNADRNKMTVVPGKEYTIGKIKIKTVPAYNIDKKFHPKEKKWVGYIITLSNGVRIYHAGDTDFIPEMKTIETDIALLPCGGTYTMTAREAGEAANTFKPKILIPMHWGSIVGSKEDAEGIKKYFKGEVEIKTVEK